MLPNFMVVGAAKSGTTSLYHLLGQPPHIYKIQDKEPVECSLTCAAPHCLGPATRGWGGGPIGAGRRPRRDGPLFLAAVLTLTAQHCLDGPTPMFPVRALAPSALHARRRCGG